MPGHCTTICRSRESRGRYDVPDGGPDGLRKVTVRKMGVASSASKASITRSKTSVGAEVHRANSHRTRMYFRSRGSLRLCNDILDLSGPTATQPTCAQCQRTRGRLETPRRETG